MADMPDCKGTCSKQEFEIEKLRIEYVIAGENPKTSRTTDEIKKSKEAEEALEKLKEKLQETKWEKACAGSGCECVFPQAHLLPAWSEWRNGAEASLTLHTYDGGYGLRCKYNIRTRIISGVCMPTSFDFGHITIKLPPKDDKKPGEGEQKVEPKKKAAPAKKKR